MPNTNRQRYCSRKCSTNKARTEKRERNELEFIGVDGEGVNLVSPLGIKSHRYVMLSVGDKTLFNGGAELTHNEIFPFLYEMFLENPTAAYVGFFLGYDFSMWLKSLPVDRAIMLFNPALRKRTNSPNPVPFPVYLGEWEFDILGMKRFKLRRKGKGPWLYVCDTGAFFQTSFLNVIEPTKEKWPTEAPCTTTEFEIIKKGKEKRANEITEGDISYYDEMAYYNTMENRILANTCSILHSGFNDVGIALKRDAYYGPGQAIQVWYNSKVNEGKLIARKDLESIIPDWVISAAISSYYGGWFEIPYHGHIPGESYEYDITSAYPHAMRNLPCLCGKWERGTNNCNVDSPITYVYGTFTGSSQSLGAMPFRNSKGNILRPNRVRGWYLLKEVLGARDAGLIDTIEIEQWIAYRPCGHKPPLAEMGDLFLKRLAIGKATPAGKAIKLMLNSGYGKFAQSIGTPKYGNPIYASMITSECRTTILDAIRTHPAGADHVVMIATDGIYFRSRHPELDAHASEQLGGWEPGIKHNLTLMKPGVYWDDSARKAIANGEIAPIKSRGISAKSLSENIRTIDNDFSALATDLSLPFPSLSISVPFSIVSPRLALARGKWETAGKVEWNVEKKDAAPLAPKRQMPYHDGSYIRSYPMTVPINAESVPYDKRFGFQDTEDDLGYTLEGTVRDALAEISQI